MSERERERLRERERERECLFTTLSLVHMKGEIWMVELGAGGNDRKKFGNHWTLGYSY